MTRRRIWILGGLAIAGVAIGAIVIGARTYGPKWLHGAVERAASRELGRELAIAGRFDLSLSLTPSLTAGEVTLANAAWGSEPSLLRIRRVRIDLDLASLWSDTVRVRELEIDDARLLLERDRAGRGNWMLAPASVPVSGESAGPPRVELQRAAIRGLEVVYRPASTAAPVELGVEELVARLDPATRMVELEGGGQFRETPWEIAGRIGTLEHLRSGHHVGQQWSGKLGETSFELRGRVRDPLVLGEPDLDVTIEGPDLATTLEQLGVHSGLTGAFRLRGRLTPETNGVGVDAEGAVGGVTLVARGVVNALTTLDRLDLGVEAAGADARVVGSWLGLDGLPQRSFELAGRVRREEGRFSLEDTAVRVGATSLTVAGELGAPPRFAGANLAVKASGRDLAELSALTRLRLPPEPFELEGRLLRRADGLEIDAARLRLDSTEIRATGSLGEPPRCLELLLTVEASGPDFALFSRTFGIDLPSRPFEVRGEVARDGSALTLDAVAGRLDEVGVTAEGRLVPVKRLVGSDLQLHVEGTDLGKLAWFPGLGGVPAEPFDARGRLRVEPDAYLLDEIEASVGRLAGFGTVRIGARSARDATSISGRVAGEALSDLAAWGLPGRLPADRFAIAGGIRIEDGVVHADDVVAGVGSDGGRLDGVLGALPDLSRLDAAVGLSGPSLAEIGRFFPVERFAAFGRLPADAYALSGRMRSSPSGYELREVRAEAAGTTVLLDGTVGSGRELRGTDLRLGAVAPNTSLLAILAGTALPTGTFEAHGRLARDDSGFHVDGLELAIGEARAGATGTLGAWPELEGTDLQLDLSGPDLAAALGPLAGRRSLPSKPFSLSMAVAGGADRFDAERFDAQLGENHLSGRLSLRRDGRLQVEADLRSRHLDLSDLLAGSAAEPSTPAPSAAPPGNGPSGGKRLLSDQPLRLAALRKLDLTLRLEAAELVIPGLDLRDVTLAGELRDGALRIDRFEGLGVHGGRTSASFAVEPLEGGYRLRTEGRLEGGRLVLSKEARWQESAPSLDLEFDLAGEGRSLHEIAASSRGESLVVVGAGELPAAIGERMPGGRPQSLRGAFTPFRETSDHAELECGIALVTIDGGQATVEPIAARTDRITLTGSGRVDLDTEEIDLSWTLKERKGLGLSAGEIANSFVKLGGTLADPRVDLTPLEALTSMGAAVATGGLTTVSKAMWGRLTAEEKVCARALKEARQRLERHQAAARP